MATKKKAATKKKVLSLQDFNEISGALELVDLEKADGTVIGQVHLKEISVDRVMRINQEEEEKQQSDTAKGFRQGIGLMVATVVTPEGESMFDEETASNLPFSVFMSIMNKVNEKFGVEPKEADKGNA